MLYLWTFAANNRAMTDWRCSQEQTDLSVYPPLMSVLSDSIVLRWVISRRDQGFLEHKNGTTFAGIANLTLKNDIFWIQLSVNSPTVLILRLSFWFPLTSTCGQPCSESPTREATYWLWFFYYFIILSLMRSWYNSISFSGLKFYG